MASSVSSISSAVSACITLSYSILSSLKLVYDILCAVFWPQTIQSHTRSMHHHFNHHLPQSTSIPFQYFLKVVTNGTSTATTTTAPGPTPAPTQRKKGFHALFPPSFTPQMGEMALCLWDFLDASSSLTGELTFTLGEIIKCIEKPKTNAPS